MRVIFLKDMANVATAGDVRQVANGFARNYLLPQGLATVATAEQMKRIDRIKRTAAQRSEKETTEQQALAHSLEGTTIALKGRVGPTAQYYGAISITQIIQELANVTGHTLERRMVQLDEALKEPGTYQVTLRLHQNVHAQINIIAEAEE